MASSQAQVAQTGPPISDAVPPVNGDVPNGEPAKNKHISYMSLPNKGQLLILCIARLADPLSMTSIQSYLFYQLKFFEPEASNSKVSTQAGIIIGARTAAQVCTSMIWGRVSDADWGGRKPVLIIGLLSSCIASIGYGFSRSYASAIAWQVFGGVMNNNVAIVRCVVAELNPEKKYRARALLLMPLCANAGMLLGPLIGGLLAYQGGNLLQSYPFAPPNLLIAALDLVAAAGAFFWLNETLENYDPDQSLVLRLWKYIKSLASRSDSNDIVTEENGSSEPSSRTPLLPKPHHHKKGHLPFRRIWTVNVVLTMLSHFIISGHLGTFSNLWAIFLSTPVEKKGVHHTPVKFGGGLGMLPRDVGFAMSLLGAIGVVLQLIIYPFLNDRFSTVKIWRAALFIFPIVYIVAPYPSLVTSETRKTALKWISMSFVLLLFVLGRTGVTPATTLLINDCTPHPSARGTIHATGTLVAHLSRTIFPIAAFAILGKGLDIGVVGLGFWCLACLAILACVVSGWVLEGSNGKEIVLPEDEEDDAPQDTGSERPNAGRST